MSPTDAYTDFEATLMTLPDLQDDAFAHELYAALCNMRWARLGRDKKQDAIDEIEGTPDLVSYTWRASGGLIAELRKKGETYLDFYCSGNEGAVSPTVRYLLRARGWEPVSWPQ